MKTVTLGWLRRRVPAPSLAWNSNTYQYYYCPITSMEDGFFVKVKKSCVLREMKEKSD